MSAPTKSAAAIVKEEWNHFRTSSSVRGLKRTMTSPTWSLKIFWILFLLAFFAVTIAQMYNVLSVYLKQKDATIMQIRKEENSPQKFPAISFCRQQPFVKGSIVMEKLRQHNATFLSQEEYSLFLNKETQDLLSLNLSTAQMNHQSQRILIFFDKMQEFVAQIPTAAVPEVAMPMKHMLLYLKLTFQNFTTGFHHLSFDVLEHFTNRTVWNEFTTSFVDFSVFYHHDYLLCHTITLKMAEAQLQQISFMDLLLWNPEIDLSTESQSSSRAAAIEGFLNGDSIMMALHPTEVHGLSAIKTSAIHLQHGKMSELHFDVTVSNFMNCARQKLQHGNSGEFSYTSGHCRFLDFDAKTRRECNCTYDPMAFPMPRCGQLHKGQSVLTEFNRRISCATKTSTESSVCSLPPCSQTEYAVSPLFYDWGINDFQWKWFWEFATNWEKGLVEYWQYRGLNASQRTQALRQPLVNFSEVSRHLSSVRIVRRSLQTTFETEVALTSAANLLSSLGGALSMYMGVTVTLVAEFAEFLVLVFRALRSRRRAVIEVQEVSAKQ